jgi:TrmH RNA methyltransferase
MGAEGAGVSAGRLVGAALRLSIPGSGAVDSLNVAAATAVLLGEHARQHGVQRPAPQ